MIIDLPKNWTELSFENLADATDFVSNGSFKSLRENVAQTEIPDYAILVRLKDYNAQWKGNFRYVTKESFEFLKKSSLKKGDLFIANVGYPGKLFIMPDLGQPMTIGPNGLRIRANESTSNNFLAYFFSSPIGKDRIQNIVAGSAQQKFNKTGFRKIKVLLPPLPEQNRIVTKVDSLMAKVDIMQKSLERLPKLLKDFRQQVLTKAVTGKLTEEWREGKVLEEWKISPLIDLIKAKPRNGFSPRGVGYPTDVKSLSLGATTSGKFDSSKVKYLNIEKPELDSHLWLKHGDILIQRSNSLEYVGTSALYTGEDFEFIYPDIMMKVQAKKDVSNKYLNYCLSSSSTKEYYRSKATGTAGNMPKINQSVVSNTPINIPPFQEQLEIVTQAESLFAKADAIEEKYQALKAKIDKLPQAILNKAFKGELVEQLPTDGDAKDLLREIQELKDKSSAKKKGNKNGPLAPQPGAAYENDKQEIDALFETINYDYEVAAIQMLTERRFGFTYGKKYTHKMFSNIELLNTMPKFKNLAFEEKGWGMFSKAIAKTIDVQRFVCQHRLDNGKQVLKVRNNSFKEVLDWTAKEENKDFVAQVNAMLDLYEKPLINKDMNRIELFNTVLECMKVLETDSFQAIRTKMDNWKMTEEYNKTKAEKFNPNETLHMIGFVKEILK